MWNPEIYLLSLPGAREPQLAAIAERIYDLVWRHDFTSPGFCLLDLGTTLDTHDLRSVMIAFVGLFNDLATCRNRTRLMYRSVGRFDQQETTRFHRDGAPDSSLLVLGYEPSHVVSRVWLADHTRCAFDMGIGPQQLLDDFNPMYRKGEDVLAPYMTELPQPTAQHSRLLLINNSALPFVETWANPLGVLHRAEIITLDESERRVVNSMMLAVGDTDEVSDNDLQAFVTTDTMSNKVTG